MWGSESGMQRGGGAVDYGGDLQDDGGFKTDAFERRGQSWYVATDIPSDLLVRVGDVNFHLHKYPLLARSGRLNRIIYESASSSSTSFREMEPERIELDDLPGGPESLELAAKFCYGIAVDLTASNISGLRCTAEFLEMTEDLEEGNLIFKTEAFLSYVVLSSWRDSIVVLKSCESLSPWSENLQIVRRCSESIAWKACANPRGIRWAYTGRPPSSRGTSPGARGGGGGGDSKESSPGRGRPVPADWWFEDVSLLRIDHFVRVVTAIKVKGMRPELIGAAIMFYAAKWLPGLAKDGPSGAAAEDTPWGHGAGGGLHLIVAGGGGGGGREQPSSSVQVREQRMMIESLISIIPPQRDSVSCSFLLRLLRVSNMLTVAPALVTELEKRVGMQLEQAALADLLIPSYNKCETLYDVDLVRRLIEHFLVQEPTEPSSPGGESFSADGPYGGGDGNQRPGAPNAKMRVARLLDSYLTEVSRDRNLSLTKFQVLAEALPETARSCDDGLYRAVDSYLKAHPTLTEHERKRLCRGMDCQKLSIDACMHAAQNERLPLRVVVQVLFSEQVKISNAIANSSLKDAAAGAAGGEVPAAQHHRYLQPMAPPRRQLLEGTPQSFQEGWAAAKKDINTLKFELGSVKAKYLELQSDMDSLQRQLEKMSLKPPAAAAAKHHSSSSAWTSGWKKLSKLTRIGVDGQEVGAPAGGGPQTRKGPRRWRNSIS